MRLKNRIIKLHYILNLVKCQIKTPSSLGVLLGGSQGIDVIRSGPKYQLGIVFRSNLDRRAEESGRHQVQIVAYWKIYSERNPNSCAVRIISSAPHHPPELRAEKYGGPLFPYKSPQCRNRHRQTNSPKDFLDFLWRSYKDVSGIRRQFQIHSERSGYKSRYLTLRDPSRR